MEPERASASTTIDAAPEAVFAVLADPSAHAAIDGTGWVSGSVDGDRITAAGQVFRMAMYHENHPDKDYRTANLVEVFDEPRAIGWKPGTESPETGELSFGGWTWRYDLEATGPSRTTVTLAYDWSAVGPDVREYLQFPPFGPDHLDYSLQHLGDLVAARGAAPPIGVTIDDARAIVAPLPRSYEALVRDRVKFRVGSTVYAAFSRDETVMGFAFPREEREALVASEPDKFLMPDPSDMRYRWVCVRLDALDVDELRELLIDAWRMCVPQKVAAAYEG